MSLCTKMVTGKHTGGPVPCGQCLLCRQNRRQKKTTRLILEAKQHEHVLFVTLTYNQDHLPTQIMHEGKYYGHELGTLNPAEPVLFLKRLRRKLPPRSLRHFYAGEYGDDNRPHYHLILFGLPYEKRHLIFDAWHCPTTGRLKCNLERLDVQIPKSEADISRYVCSYIVKGLTNESNFRQNGYTGQTNADKLQGRYPEFARGSLGIGRTAIDSLIAALDNPSGSNSINLNGDIPRHLMMNGKQLPLDRYMREKILDGLQIKEKIKEEKLSAYEKDMRALYVRARSNPQIPPSWTLAPFDKALPRERAWALEKQMQHEQAQSALVSIQRASLKKGP